MLDILGTVPLMPSPEGAPPLLAVLPFAAYLLGIAVLPLVATHWWEHNRNKLIVAVAVSIPVVIYLLTHEGGGHHLFDSAKEYGAFITLLASLFIISGGIYIKGSLSGTPIVNTVFLGIGALMASFVGTTGASMLLIRPLLRANAKRKRVVHLVVFFIFIVSNGAGMLTPLGDPPLFLGFLRGVPFAWTLKLWAPWLLVNGALLALFNILDQMILNKEEKVTPGAQLEEVQKHEPLGIQGGLNFLWLLGVVGVIYVMGAHGAKLTSNVDGQLALQIVGMGAMAGLSMALTPKQVRAANKFGWGPIIEVAVIFIGIFITMVPALEYLKFAGKSGDIRLAHAWQYFWASGVLSSFLDNAPTYLVFVTLGQGAGAIPADLRTVADNLFLAAVSCGSVFMGANTYIGNGPNFMVKAIAEENGVKMPSFFGYMAWSCAILIPLFIVVTFLFFRG
jgi:Na+/H+ antiporter NhaD/arsenite permease-like protein